MFYSRWITYLEQYAGIELQDGCRPQLIEPVTGSDYRGTVVLIHSWGACPQQFGDLAELLALRGYRVMLPLLPGHGRRQSGSLAVPALPTERNWENAFAAFAETVNGIAGYAGGQRIIGGHSVGAIVSLSIAARASSRFDQLLLWAPYFGPAADSAARREWLEQATERCLDNRTLGYAGYCGSAVRSSAVPVLLGRQVRGLLPAENTGPVQFVAIEDDPVADNAAILAVSQVQPGSSTCIYPRDVPHDLFDRFGEQSLDRYWLDSLLSGALDFIMTGRFYPVRPDRIGGLPVCELQTERAG